LFRSKNFFRTTRELEYFILLLRKAANPTDLRGSLPNF
jgi:hypothetical protein